MIMVEEKVQVIADEMRTFTELARGTVEGTANFMQEINLLKFSLEKRLTTLEETIQKLITICQKVIQYVS